MHFMHEVRSIGVTASITIVHIRKFYSKISSILVLFRIAKRSIDGMGGCKLHRVALSQITRVWNFLAGWN